MIPYCRLSLAKMTLSFVLAMSVIFWGISCQTFQQSSFAPAYDRFYNARVVRDFTLKLADGVGASCRRGDERIMDTGDMVRQLRALAQDIDDAINGFIDTPQGNDRVINAINAAAKAGRPALEKMILCGGSPPEVPRVPGYFETFWDIAS